jgi:hypothetical protein
VGGDGGSSGTGLMTRMLGLGEAEGGHSPVTLSHGETLAAGMDGDSHRTGHVRRAFGVAAWTLMGPGGVA